MSAIVHLDGSDARRRELVGGKAAWLHRLRVGGIPCPPGVVVSTGAYRAFLGTLAPDRQLAPLLRGAAADDELRRRLVRLHATQPVPAAVAAPLEEALRGLPDGGNGFAVRSSAADEDGHRHSFAGVYVTRLATPADEVAEAVRGCWASLWSAEAVSYRTQARSAEETPAIAVVVQPLLAAAASGVVFTRDVTGDAERVRVEVTCGLGEPLVSGKISADTFLVDRVTLAVEHAVLGAKEATLHVADGRLRPGGGRPGQYAVSEERVEELVDLCLRAERQLGEPLDIEAVLVEDTLVEGTGWFLTQARPITATVPG